MGEEEQQRSRPSSPPSVPIHQPGTMAEPVGVEEAPRIGKRCYVGNLAWKTSWQDLKDKFREIGNVVYANVMRDDDGEDLRLGQAEQPPGVCAGVWADYGPQRPWRRPGRADLRCCVCVGRRHPCKVQGVPGCVGSVCAGVSLPPPGQAV